MARRLRFGSSKSYSRIDCQDPMVETIPQSRNSLTNLSRVPNGTEFVLTTQCACISPVRNVGFSECAD